MDEQNCTSTADLPQNQICKLSTCYGRCFLQTFLRISMVCNEIHIDFADPEPTSYGLSSTGNSLIKEDILGNQTRQHSFILYSTFSGINDFERQENSTALLELSVWLKNQIGGEVETETDGEKHKEK